MIIFPILRISKQASPTRLQKKKKSYYFTGSFVLTGQGGAIYTESKFSQHATHLLSWTNLFLKCHKSLFDASH